MESIDQTSKAWIWGRYLLEAVAVCVLLIFGYVFFSCILTPFKMGGIVIRQPGDMAIPLFCSLAILSFRLKPWQWTDRRAFWFYLALFLFFLTILFHPHAGSDAAQYYANLRSIWLDGDLNFYDDALRNPGLGSDYLKTLSPRGFTYNGFSVGPAFFWSPFFLLGQGYCRVANLFSSAYACDGYDTPTMFLVCFGSALYAALGAALAYRLVRQFVSAGAAMCAVVLGTFATPLLLYQFYEGAYSHSLGFLTGVLILSVWWKRYEHDEAGNPYPSFPLSAGLGLVCGLAMLVRWQSGIFLIFPLFDFFRHSSLIFRKPRDRKKKLARLVSANALFVICLFIAILPQLLLWYGQTGHFFQVPQGEDYLSNLYSPQIGKVLFSKLHGLFSWHPVLLIATLLLPLLVRRNRPLLYRSLVVLAVQIYIGGAVTDWWAGGSFGQRRFCASLILWMIPLGYGFQVLFRWASEKPVRVWVTRLVVLASGFLILFNLMLLVQYMHGFIGYMGELQYGEFFRRWTANGNNSALIRMQGIFIYMPLTNAVGYGILFRDGLLLLRGIIPLAAAGFLIAWFFRREFPGKSSFLQGVKRHITLALIGLLILFSGWIFYASKNSQIMMVVNLKEGVPHGNIRQLVVSENHRYVGGYIEQELKQGEELSVRFDREVVVDSIALVSYLEPGIRFEEGSRIGVLELQQRNGAIVELPVLYGIHVLSSHAEAEEPWRFTDSGTRPIETRRWKPNLASGYLARSWYGCWPLTGRETVVGMCLRSEMPQGAWQIEGVALLPGNEGQRGGGFGLKDQYLFIDFQKDCNAAYDHNVFLHYDTHNWSHLKFTEPILYKDQVPFQLYPPYDESGKWNALSTCFQDGNSYRFRVKPKRRLESLHLAYTAGVIRSRDERPLVSIVVGHLSGKQQVEHIHSGRDAFEYLHGYRPSGSVIAGGESGYMYDGKLSVFSFPIHRKNDPVVAVSVVDANGIENAGISVLAITGAYSRPHLGQKPVKIE